MSIVDDIQDDAKRIPHRTATIGVPGGFPWRMVGGVTLIALFAVALAWWIGAHG